MRYTIYLNSKHNWYNKLKEYSISNEWSISHAISHIIEEYFSNKLYMVNGTDKPIIINGVTGIETPKPIFIAKPKKQKPIVKVDPEEYFAEIEAKLIPINSNVENCDRRTIDSTGTPSCYFKDNFKEYYPYCVKDCWGNVDIWGSRAIKLKPIEETK